MKSIKIYGIMVIYNRCLEDSLTYQCLRKRDIELVICDNSTSEFGNEEVADKDGLAYISMNGNKGLSVAYNHGLDYIFEKYAPEDSDRICLFDDDTRVPAEYLKAICESEADILLPIVRDAIGLMSPVRMKGRIAKRFSGPEEAMNVKVNEISGINSAMSVKASIFKHYRYNENMFLDYIDHMFIMDMRKKMIYPKVILIDIEQKFSAIEDSKESEIKRFKIQKKDLKIFYSNNPFLYYYIVIKKHLKLMKKYKDIRMLIC